MQSGLPENTPRVDNVMYKMIKEKLTSTIQVRTGKQKEIDRNIRLNKHRDSMLANMVRDKARNPSLVPAPTTTAAVVDQDPKDPLEPNQAADTAVSSLSSTSTTNAADSIEQKWLAIMESREARRAEKAKEPSLQSALLELEKKRVDMEEQRLRLDEQRIQVERMNAENNRRMFELLAQRMPTMN